jgi:hypothetical protein
MSMQYYTFELDVASNELCTICPPFGNYRYNRLPVGTKQSPEIAQQIMGQLLRPYPERLMTWVFSPLLGGNT